MFYHFGIIDYFMEWSAGKMVENLAKKAITMELGKDREIVTAVNPDKYAQRLIEFIDSILP